MNLSALSKQDSEVLKGIAILMIMIHNFMHLFPTPKENEFDFAAVRFEQALSGFINAPEESMQLLFSFFGHFGVQVFIFLSAYGLTKKYKNQVGSFKLFIKDRCIKTYPAFLLAIILWAIIVGWRDYGALGPVKVVYWQWDALLYKLTLMSNFIPGQSFMPVGPWWFLPFIFQFYLIFPILLKLHFKFGGAGLLTLSVFTMGVTILLEGDVNGMNLYKLVLGHIPEFCLGIYLAKKGSCKVPVLVIVIALIVFLLGNVNHFWWYFNHISFLILFISTHHAVKPLLDTNFTAMKFFSFFGRYSMALFLVNGFLRKPMVDKAIESNDWLFTVLMCAIFIFVSVCVGILLTYLEKIVLSQSFKKT